MDTFNAIKTILAVRCYQAKHIVDEMVTRIVEAGRLTGSSRNTQEWNFIVVRSADRLRKLGN
jgi:nitroreductase